ncbi:MAG: hypothetical protein ACXAEN_23190 [Candidatus Thorarchaeota archaeon]|jgi:hypothetical protein
MIPTGYGGSFQYDEKVIVIDTTYGGIEDILGPSRTPSNLIGKTGTIVEIHDDRYDTDRPTGYERIYVVVQESDGSEFTIDACCIKKV